MSLAFAILQPSLGATADGILGLRRHDRRYSTLAPDCKSCRSGSTLHCKSLLLSLAAAGCSCARRRGFRPEAEISASEASALKSLDWRFVSIALPACAQLITEPLAGIVDTACCGHLSLAALGGMGVAVAAQYSLTKTFNDPLLRVTTSLVASAREEERREAVLAVLLLALALGLFQVLTFGTATESAIQGMGLDASSAMFRPAVAYLRCRSLGAPFSSMLLALTGICRGLGDARTPLYASAVTTIVNIILDPLLIFTLSWGCAGAACATVVAQACGVFLIAALLRGKLGLARGHEGGKRFFVLLRVLRRFVATAGVMIARNWGKVFCFTFLAREAALQGPVVAAAYSLTFQLGFATSQVAESLATSTQVMLAQALKGAKSPSYAFAPLPAAQAAGRVVRRGLQAGLVLSALLGTFTFFAQGRLLRLMTSEAPVRAVASAAMPCVLMAQVFKALAYPMNGALMGALDWMFSAAALWLAGAAGVGLYFTCASLGLAGRSQAGALASLWIGLMGFFGTQLVLGLARIASGRGRWQVLRE